jgi:hypothetical protein
MPDQEHRSHNLGTKCGRRERESRSEGRREQSLRVRTGSFVFVTVEGILAFWKAALFAGCRQNEGLGRSAAVPWVSPQGRGRADDSGCPEDAEEGNVVGMRHKAYARGTRRSCGCREDASFTRSFDPCTSILTTHRGASLGGGATARHHGWANPRKREEPTLGSGRTDVARLAACHRFRAKSRSSLARREKEGDRGLRPCEDLELGSGCSHVVVVAEVGRRRLASNKLGKRAPKRAVRVE